MIENGQIVYRPDMDDQRYPEEAVFVSLGLRCRLAAPLLLGGRSMGMISLVRVEPDSFSEDEIELVAILGRFLGSAVQNIRAYEAERATVEEVRKLSALRADFVSLVSHELRSPMAAVIGSATTLRERWRELTPDQRESFLGADRARDEAPRRSRRRRPRHVPHRVRELQLLVRGRRRRGADP